MGSWKVLPPQRLWHPLPITDALREVQGKMRPKSHVDPEEKMQELRKHGAALEGWREEEGIIPHISGIIHLETLTGGTAT